MLVCFVATLLSSLAMLLVDDKLVQEPLPRGWHGRKFCSILGSIISILGFDVVEHSTTMEFKRCEVWNIWHKSWWVNNTVAWTWADHQQPKKLKSSAFHKVNPQGMEDWMTRTCCLLLFQKEWEPIVMFSFSKVCYYLEVVSVCQCAGCFPLVSLWDLAS